MKIIKTLINKKEQEEKENAASKGLRVARSSRRASIVEVCTEIGEYLFTSSCSFDRSFGHCVCRKREKKRGKGKKRREKTVENRGEEREKSVSPWQSARVLRFRGESGSEPSRMTWHVPPRGRRFPPPDPRRQKHRIHRFQSAPLPALRPFPFPKGKTRRG